MNRILLFLALSFPLAIMSCKQAPVITETDPDLGYTTEYTSDPESGKYHGPYTRRNAEGLLLETGSLHQGAPHGIRELYYPDGKVQIRERYVSGRLDDRYEYYHPNGQLELAGYYIEGAMYGCWRKYSNDGQLLEEVMMIQNEEHGPFTEYHPNGMKKAEGTYIHGPNEDGRLKMYDESGQLHKEMLCQAGRCYTVWQKE